MTSAFRYLFIRTVSLIALSILLPILTACGPSPRDVAEKIDNQETLDDSDYRCIIKYLDDFADAQTAAGDNTEELIKVNQQYTHWMTFAFALVAAPDEIRNTEAYRKLESKLDKSQTPD